MSTPRISTPGEDLTGKVCACSLGRVGIVYAVDEIEFANGDKAKCHAGFGLDGNGLWATGTGKPVVVLAENLEEYARRVDSRPSNFQYGKAAVLLTKSKK